MKTLHLASRCAGERASHAASPIASLPAAIAASATSRLAARAALHVSVSSSVCSLSRCSPIESGDGPPAAAQLPAPCILSCAARHSSSSRRACAKMFLSTDHATASAVPPAVSDAPRITTSTDVPGAS